MMRTNGPLVPSSSRGTVLHPPKRDSVSSAVVPRTPPSAHDEFDSDEYDLLDDEVGNREVARAFFGYAPSTQTTTVTTVTTTTTSFPALEIIEPSLRQQIDTRHFPLAAKPTPKFLKNIEFSLGPSRTTFREEVTKRQPRILPELANVLTTPFQPEHTIKHNTEHSTNSAMEDTTHKRKRVKIDDDDEPSPSSHLLNGQRVQYTFDSPSSPSHRGPKENTSTIRASKSPQRRTFNPEAHAHSLTSTREDSGDDFEMVDSLKRPREPSPANFEARPRLRSPMQARASRASTHAPTLPSTSIAPGSEHTLISPSLSPVTAAAQSGLQRQDYFEHPAWTSPPNEAEELIEAARTSLGSPLIKPQQVSKSLPSTQTHQPTMMDIPAIISTFDAMPVMMKSYLMHQLLRRSPTRVLQFVMNTIDPALRCDFVKDIPAEITEQIFGYLSVPDLCSASQVSKSWRTAIDTNEKLWFEKCRDEEFRFSSRELHQAIQQGWGWQTSSGRRDPDKDWSRKTEISKNRPSFANIEVDNPLRKELQDQHAAALKVERHIAQLQESNISDLLQCGRYTGAKRMAMMARREISGPKEGLPSLAQLHFWKSLCRRHYAIRQGWLDDSIKPAHIAIPATPNVITCLQFDDKRIVTGCDDKPINVYSTATGKLLGVLEGHSGGVWAMEFYGDTLVSGATDRSVCVFDLNKMVCTHDFRGHSSTIRCLQILESPGMSNDFIHNPSGSRPIFITGARDHTIKVWFLPMAGDPVEWRDLGDLEQHNPYFIRTLVGHTDSVRTMQAHGDILISGSYDFDVRVWQISTGEPLYRLEGHTSKVYSVVYDHENNRCISGSIDSQIKIWNLLNGTILHTLEGHNSLVGLLDYKGGRLVSASADATLRMWNIDSGRCKATLSAHTGPITCFQHDDQKIISGSEKHVKMWDVDTGEFRRDLLTELTGLWRVNFDYRRCIAAVQRQATTFIEIMDYGAWRDGVAESSLGKRMVMPRETPAVASSAPRREVARAGPAHHRREEQVEARDRMIEG